jgi:ribonucleoside-diphosphate reductase alpha chain
METYTDDGLELTDNACKVLERRYLRKDAQGKSAEQPADMFRRVARNIAQADLLYDATADVQTTEEEFYSAITRLEFLPNSPTLMNAGRDLQQLSACFVLPIDDSMEGIFETLKNTSLIHKSGGGTGFAFSRLRPKNSMVQTTGGIASGPVSFMRVFDAATQAVKQGGTRRGANMGILRVDHPDILEFIRCKEKDAEISNFNISVALTEDFMKEVENDEEYALIDPRTKKIIQQLKARDVFNLIVTMAWKNGEPGIIFLDRINRDNPTPQLGEIESTNPCGEQPLLPYESCNLGSINLSAMVDEITQDVDWEKLGATIRTAVHFLDNVIDMNRYPLKRIEEMTKANRKIGLGVMGFADMLIKLEISYNSADGVKKAREIMNFILKEAEAASCALAEKRGTFPNFKQSMYNVPNGPHLRNATLTTIAPTGTLSIIAGCSSGIEPLFAVSFVRTVMDKDALPETNPIFERIAKERGFYSVELMKLIAQKGSIQKLPEVPDEVKRLFVTAHDISPEWHARMQAAFQECTHNAVSKTVNFSHKATEEDVRRVYMLAYTLGCKGVTIYRDGSREEQVLSTKKADTKTKADGKISPRPRPVVTRGTTTKVSTGCGNLYVTINEDDKKLPFEVFMQMGKAGGCAMSQLEAIGRLVSLALRSGINIKSIIEQLRGIRCPSPSWEKGGRIFSCSDAIARVVEQQLIKVKENGEKNPNPVPEPTQSSDTTGTATLKAKLGNVVGVCPDCGGALRTLEGCMVCHSCGYSKCG